MRIAGPLGKLSARVSTRAARANALAAFESPGEDPLSFPVRFQRAGVRFLV
jgi:hypothetical protein